MPAEKISESRSHFIASVHELTTSGMIFFCGFVEIPQICPGKMGPEIHGDLP